MGIGKVLEGLDFGEVWLHALCSEYSTAEGNLRLPDPTLQAVEDYTMLLGCLHQLEEVSLTVLGVWPYMHISSCIVIMPGRQSVAWSICI